MAQNILAQGSFYHLVRMEKLVVDVNDDIAFQTSIHLILSNEPDNFRILEIYGPTPAINWVIPTLPQLVELNVVGLTNLVILSSENLQRLQRLYILCGCDAVLYSPIQLFGTFQMLHSLTVDSILFSINPSLSWTCLPNVQNLKIIAICRKDCTTISHLFKIPSNFSNVKNLEIKFEMVEKLNVYKEWKRWIGTSCWPNDICNFRFNIKTMKRSGIGFSNLCGLKTLKLSGIWDIMLYQLWIKAIIFLTKTTQLLPLDEVVLETTFDEDSVPTLYDYTFEYLELEDLKKLRLVNKKFYNKSTCTLRSHYTACVCIQPDNVSKFNNSTENFIYVMSKSIEVPFQRVRLQISTWTYDEIKFGNFIDQYGWQVYECHFSCTGTDLSTTLNIFSKIRNILFKAVDVKNIILTNLGNLSNNEDLKIELPPTVQIVSIRNYDQKGGSNHVCIGNETLSAVSMMNLNSSPILEVHCVCSTCFAFMLEETAGKGFHEILLKNNFHITVNNLDDIIKISEFKSPVPRMYNLEIHGHTNQANVLFDAINCILKSSENHMESFQIWVYNLSIVPHNFVIPKLQHLGFLLLKVANVMCTLEANNLKKLRILRLQTRQLSETCPFTINGQFRLSVLELDSSLLCFVSSKQWASSFSSVQWLTIIISKATGKTTVPENFKILSDFNSVQHLKIEFSGVQSLRNNYFCGLDKCLEFKRWTGADLGSKISEHQEATSLIGLCELKELSTLKVFGLDSRTYGLWIKILVYLTQTTQLHPLSRIVLKPNSLSQRPATQLWTAEQYLSLVPYHRCVNLLDWEQN